VATLEPGANLANAMHVDDGGAVNADKIAWVEFVHQGLHGFAHVVQFAGDMEAGIVAFGADPIDVGDLDEENAATHGDSETLGIVGLGVSAVEEREETMCSFFVLAAEATIAGAAESAGEAIGREGLEVTGIWSAPMVSTTRKPSISGIWTSRKTRSGFVRRIVFTAASPSPHWPMTLMSDSFLSRRRSALRARGSSSTTSARRVMRRHPRLRGAAAGACAGAE
jgi:hypothetical protein